MARTSSALFSSGARFQQTLHGYDGGHRLLESSANLPPATRRQMLLLSDISGPEMEKNFDGYLTGYPLSEIKAYALARTWYANEMPRPGCVWTHTLLVPFSVLEKEFNVFDWVGCLRRPQRGGTEAYHIPLIVEPRKQAHSISTFSRMQITPLLDSVYSYPNHASVVPATAASDWEDIVLSLWAYQWPRLRRNFTFCTGALSPRFFGEKTFDLQVAPMVSARIFGREHDRYHILNTTMTNRQLLESKRGNMSDRLREESNYGWLDVAVDGTIPEKLAQTDAQHFCWKYGSEVRPDRSAFIPLLETFVDVARERSFIGDERISATLPSAYMLDHLTILVQNVAERFPLAYEARMLKVDMFSDPAKNALWEPGKWLEGEILQVLATTDRHASYEADVLCLAKRAFGWTSEHPQQAAPLLQKILQTFISPLGEAISSGILSALTPEMAFTLAQDNPGLLPIFVDTYPSLAIVPSVWSGSASEQRAILDVVQRGKDQNWQQIAVAVLTAGTGSVAKEVMGRLGSSGIALVLDWANGNDNFSLSRLPSEWQELLSAKPDSLMTWLITHSSARLEVVAYVSSLLDPHASDTLGLTDTTWWQLSRAISTNKIPSSLHLQVATFLLSIAFYNKGKYSPQIASSVFQIVHDATAHNKLPHDIWRLIDPHLPHLGGLKEWDKCEKLRQTLVNSFIKFEWPVSFMFSAIKDEYTFYRVVDFCRDNNQDKMFLKSLQKASNSEHTEIKRFHREALKEKHFLQRLFD